MPVEEVPRLSQPARILIPAAAVTGAELPVTGTRSVVLSCGCVIVTPGRELLRMMGVQSAGMIAMMTTIKMKKNLVFMHNLPHKRLSLV